MPTYQTEADVGITNAQHRIRPPASVQPATAISENVHTQPMSKDGRIAATRTPHTRKGVSMRLILIGTEYVGKTTLANALRDWGMGVGKKFHMDDGDFTIPDYHHLNQEDQLTMWNMSPVLKERFQRMVIYYHLEILERYNDCIFGGFHIEEKIFGPRYYHPGHEVTYHRWLEHKMPGNCILVHMTCDPEVIRRRMKEYPHPYQLVESNEIGDIMAEFASEYGNSYIRQKVDFDTTDLTPSTILDAFLEAVRPQLDARDLIFLDSVHPPRGTT